MLASYAVYITADRGLSMGGALPFLIAAAVATASYFGLCVALGVVSKDDLKMIKRKK